MRINRNYLYLMFVISILLLNLFVLKINDNWLLLLGAILILASSLIIFKYKPDNFYLKKSVLITMVLIGMLQVVLYYVISIDAGYVENIVKVNHYMSFRITIPMTLIIITNEIWRYILSSKFDDSKFSFLVVIVFVLFDINLFGTTYNLHFISQFLEFIGIVIFPSLVSNIVYNKIVKIYGYKPVLAYRLITIISLYLIPILPNVHILIRMFARVLMPLIIYLIISYMFDRIEFEKMMYKNRKFDIIAVILFIFIIGMAYLQSCLFTYGIVTIGSGSMTGTLNIGDTVVYKKYNNEDINVGDIIIYDSGNKKVIHRVIEMGVLNNQHVYVTKGDANKTKDEDYVYNDKVVGMVKLRIRYIGYPSIWLRDILIR